MRRNIALLLIVLGIGCGIYAYTNSHEDKAVLKLGGFELSAVDKEASQKTTILYVLAGLSVLAGAAFLVRK